MATEVLSRPKRDVEALLTWLVTLGFVRRYKPRAS